MRPICWLHISDIHMRVIEKWSHDVVLEAMCKSIAKVRSEGVCVDFILVTGDLAFSGKIDEYKLVEAFFDELRTASGVSKDRIFCIPGNHDVDRGRQRMCFQGVRHELMDASHVDSFLCPGEDFETLLKRQENYQGFQGAYFQSQSRILTSDKLGYVSCVKIENVQFAIIGLNSAWLADGGLSDHGKLIMGERQVINAIGLAREHDAHIIVAMAHHPFHLLQEFDRGPVQSRIENACQFFHCGHLHDPETRLVRNTGSDCLTVMAGASFDTRQFHNSYSILTLDLLQAKRSLKTIQYNPRSGSFERISQIDHPFEVTPAAVCGVKELAAKLTTHRPSLASCAHYLAALLLNAKSDVPILGQNGYTFGSFGVLQALPNGESKAKAMAFKAFSNVLRVFYGRVELAELLVRYGEPVVLYGEFLQEISNSSVDLKVRLMDQEKDSRMIAETELVKGESHTSVLFAALCAEGDWPSLREHAARHLESSDQSIAVQSKRMLALGLAQSVEDADKRKAVELYRTLVTEGLAAQSDVAILTAVLMDIGKLDEAKVEVLDGIHKLEITNLDGLYAVGHKIVEATGDREFRKKLEAAIAARTTRD